jgi:magnesium transporter
MLLVPERTQAYVEEVANRLKAGEYEAAAAASNNLSYARMASLLTEMPRDTALPFLEAAGPDRAAQVVPELPVEFAAQILCDADPGLASAWLSRMAADMAADIIAALPDENAEVLIARLSEDVRNRVRRLSRYPEGTIGAAMSPYFSAVRRGKTVGETIAVVRATPMRLTRTGYVYVVDGEGRLEGVVSLRDLLLAQQSGTVESIMKRDVFAVRVDNDAHDAANRLRRRRLKMLPVVDENNVLVGVLTIEDAVDLLSSELAEEFSGIGAISPDETFFTPPRQAIRMRLPWMAANVFLNLGAVTVIASFEDTIAQVVILAAFLPMITDMGGNVGIQALSVSIRSIALGEALVHEYWNAARKEAAIGIINGLVLGALFGVIAQFMGGNPMIGLVAGFALAVNVLVAGVVGGTMPFLIKRLGKDPAMMTGPVLTTITDITGVTIYLGLATVFLGAMMGGV